MIDQSFKKADPNLRDLLDIHTKEVMLAMNCHAIARVQSFDSAKQTITATINYKKTIFQKSANDKYEAVLIDYPILLDVPVVVMGGGAFRLTFPIQKGDDCLILFNDRSIDNWFKSGQVVGVSSPRLHSLSDGIAIVGLNSLQSSIDNYDMTRAMLRNGETMVGISETLVKIANNTTTLMTALANLIDAVENIVTTNCVPGSPVALNPASIAALEVVKTELQGLLE